MAKSPRVLVVECMQEISSFNPLQSGYENFHIERGEEMLAQDGLNTGLGGALPVLRAAGYEIVLTIAARAGSGGLLSAAGWARLSKEVMDAVRAGAAGGIDAVYFSLHGAMGADGELDPEGWLLQETRKIVGEDVPIVISLDLHGILTDRMLKQVNGLAIYHTYPHVDFADTGERAAKLLVRIMTEKLRTSIARVVIPALARGDECVTKSGCYGDMIREAQRIERDGTALAAGIMIGNPFTDVPELCTQVLVCTAGDEATAKAQATRIAEEMWPLRFRLQGKFISLERAIAQAETIKGRWCSPTRPTPPPQARPATAPSSSTVCTGPERASACSPRSSTPPPRPRPTRRAWAPPSTSPSAAPSIRSASSRWPCGRR